MNLASLYFNVNIYKIGIITSKSSCKNKCTPVKHLEQCLAQSKCSLNVSIDDDDFSIGLDVMGDRML